jgi:hypothetical protein
MSPGFENVLDMPVRTGAILQIHDCADIIRYNPVVRMKYSNRSGAKFAPIPGSYLKLRSKQR